MKKFNLTRDQTKKIAISTISFVVLLYVYFNFFLGPLNRSHDSMLASIEAIQKKLGNSKSEISKASNLERQAGKASTHFAELKASNPEGAPIAWFPPRMKSFFANQQIDKVATRMDGSVAYKEPELADWMKCTWQIDIPQSDFISVGHAIAELENQEPLLTVTKITIRAMPESPGLQQVTLIASSATVKR